MEYRSMDKKTNLLIILFAIALSVLGASSLYGKYGFYKRAYKATATVTRFSKTQLCQISYKNCKYEQAVSLSFADYRNKPAVATAELSTVTLISGIISVGDKLTILYVPNRPTYDLMEAWSPVKNLGPLNYETVEVYTWHYWVYPCLLVLAGPLLYVLSKKIWQDMVKRKAEQNFPNS